MLFCEGLRIRFSSGHGFLVGSFYLLDFLQSCFISRSIYISHLWISYVFFAFVFLTFAACPFDFQFLSFGVCAFMLESILYKLLL